MIYVLAKTFSHVRLWAYENDLQIDKDVKYLSTRNALYGARGSTYTRVGDWWENANSANLERDLLHRSITYIDPDDFIASINSERKIKLEQRNGRRTKNS